MMEGVGEELDLAELAETLEPEDLMEADDDAPIIRLINALLTEAIKVNASDVHVEPFENRLRIRFRVDGMLREILKSVCHRMAVSLYVSLAVVLMCVFQRYRRVMVNAW